jgi:hypothetical protein
MNRERTLARDVVATQIPSGDKQTLPQHARVFLHQTLGGSYTVQTDFGLFRIDGRDGPHPRRRRAGPGSHLGATAAGL